MKKFKGTKGEWKVSVEENTNGWVYVNYSDGSATVRTEDFIKDEKDYGKLDLLTKTIANAKLIAAAPELLEALQNIENDNGSIPATIWKLRNEAINKALD